MQKNIRDRSLLYTFLHQSSRTIPTAPESNPAPPLLLLAPLLTNSTILYLYVLSHSYGGHGSTGIHRRKLNYSLLKQFSKLLNSNPYFKVSLKPGYVFYFHLPNILNNPNFQIDFSHRKIKEQSKFFQHLSGPHCINAKLTKKRQLNEKPKRSQQWTVSNRDRESMLAPR